MADNVQATGWLMLKATRSPYRHSRDEVTGLGRVESAKIVGLRANRPATLGKDEVAIRVTLAVPGALFDPVVPTAVITVPPDLVVRGPIEVTATDPGEEPDRG